MYKRKTGGKPIYPSKRPTMFQFLNRAVLVDPIRAKLKLGYEQRPCSCIQYFNAKANHLPQELKLARTAQELNGIQIVSPTLPVAPPYVNFPNMSIKEKEDRKSVV